MVAGVGMELADESAESSAAAADVGAGRRPTEIVGGGGAGRRLAAGSRAGLGPAELAGLVGTPPACLGVAELLGPVGLMGLLPAGFELTELVGLVELVGSTTAGLWAAELAGLVGLVGATTAGCGVAELAEVVELAVFSSDVVTKARSLAPEMRLETVFGGPRAAFLAAGGGAPLRGLPAGGAALRAGEAVALTCGFDTGLVAAIRLAAEMRDERCRGGALGSESACTAGSEASVATIAWAGAGVASGTWA